MFLRNMTHIDVLINSESPLIISSICVIFSIIVHIVNFILLSSIRYVPLLHQLLQKTGLLPHLCDHIAFGLTVGITLSYLKHIKNDIKQK